MTEPLLRKGDVEDLLRISTRSLERLVSEGRLRPVRLGARTVRFRPEDVRELVKQSRDEEGP